MTIFDIARLAGVSAMTVTRAFQKNSKIRPERRAHILAICEQHGYTPNNAAGRLTSRPIRLCACVTNIIGEFTAGILGGLNAASKELSDYKVTSEIVTIDAGADYYAQVCSAIRRFADEGCDGLLLGMFGMTPELSELFALLEQKNIPVVQINNVVPDIASVFNVTNNLPVAGRMAFQLLDMATGGGTGEFAVFTGSQQSSIHSTLYRSFADEARAAGRGLVLYDTQDNPSLAAGQAREMLREHPRTGGIYISSANSVSVVEAVISEGRAREVKIVASDIFPRLAQFIADGTVSASIFQNPYRQSKTAMTRLYRYITGRSDVSGDVLITPQVIIRSNLELYAKSTQVL